jgi:hypothetical protein
VTVQALHRVKNILVITEVIITTLFDQVLIAEVGIANFFFESANH